MMSEYKPGWIDFMIAENRQLRMEQGKVLGQLLEIEHKVKVLIRLIEGERT